MVHNWLEGTVFERHPKMQYVRQLQTDFVFGAFVGVIDWNSHRIDVRISGKNGILLHEYKGTTVSAEALRTIFT